MSLTVLASAKGSPGATTLAILLARALSDRSRGVSPSVYLVDSDPDGGDIALRLGLDPAPSVGTLALAGRHGFDESVLLAHSQRSRNLPGVAVVAGVSGCAQRSAVDWVSRPLAGLAASLAVPVVVDAGRTGALQSTRALFEAAAVVALLCRTDTASLVHTRSALVSMSAEDIGGVVVLTGATNDHPDEIARALGRPIAGLVPELPVIAGSPWSGGLSSQAKARRKSAEATVQALLSVLLGETSPLAVPSTEIKEHAPEAALSAALHSRHPSVSR